MIRRKRISIDRRGLGIGSGVGTAPFGLRH
jgi:hypothetical protein